MEPCNYLCTTLGIVESGDDLKYTKAQAQALCKHQAILHKVWSVCRFGVLRRSWNQSPHVYGGMTVLTCVLSNFHKCEALGDSFMGNSNSSYFWQVKL